MQFRSNLMSKSRCNSSCSFFMSLSPHTATVQTTLIYFVAVSNTCVLWLCFEAQQARGLIAAVPMLFFL